MQGTLSGVVVDLDVSIFYIACQRVPTRDHRSESRAVVFDLRESFDNIASNQCRRPWIIALVSLILVLILEGFIT